MFKTTVAPAVELAPAATMDEVVPLSHVALDFGGVPPEGWPLFLGRRGIAIVPDSLGRDSIGCDAARHLFDEQRANELRKARLRAEAEAAAVEQDQLRRAQIWRGVSADMIPVGVHPATAMLQSARDAQPKRRSPLEESLAGETMAYHAFGPHPDEG